MDILLSTEEAARALSVSQLTLRRMAQRGEIARVRVARLWKFEKSEIEAFKTRNRQEVRPVKRQAERRV